MTARVRSTNLTKMIERSQGFDGATGRSRSYDLTIPVVRRREMVDDGIFVVV